MVGDGGERQRVFGAGASSAGRYPHLLAPSMARTAKQTGYRRQQLGTPPPERYEIVVPSPALITAIPLLRDPQDFAERAESLVYATPSACARRSAGDIDAIGLRFTFPTAESASAARSADAYTGFAATATFCPPPDGATGDAQRIFEVDSRYRMALAPTECAESLDDRGIGGGRWPLVAGPISRRVDSCYPATRHRARILESLAVRIDAPGPTTRPRPH